MYLQPKQTHKKAAQECLTSARMKECLFLSPLTPDPNFFINILQSVSSLIPYHCLGYSEVTRIQNRHNRLHAHQVRIFTQKSMQCLNQPQGGSSAMKYMFTGVKQKSSRGHVVQSPSPDTSDLKKLNVMLQVYFFLSLGVYATLTNKHWSTLIYTCMVQAISCP